MIVPYTKIPFNNKRGYYYQPLLPVTFSHKGKPFRINALVDSGAQTTGLNAQIATFFGIDYRKCPKGQAYGIEGAGKETWKYELKMVIDNLPNSELIVPLQFIESRSVGAILGHGAFFDNFILTFEAYSLRFQIDHKPNQFWLSAPNAQS